MHTRFILALLSSLLLMGQASAGPITVFTEVWSGSGDNTVRGPGLGGEIPVGGLGNWAALTWGSGTGPTVTVPSGQATASQVIGGFWPVMQFSNLAQYQAQSSKVVSVPVTPLQLYVEVWDGAYGAPGVPFKQLFPNATVSGQISPTVGQNTVNWQFASMPVQATFADGTVVTVSYQPILMPSGMPQIQFQDGTPSLGGPDTPTYYPTQLEVNVTVSSSVTTPEPSSALLLAGLTLSGLIARRSRRLLWRHWLSWFKSSLSTEMRTV
jgi:hypothetical protein